MSRGTPNNQHALKTGRHSADTKAPRTHISTTVQLQIRVDIEASGPAIGRILRSPVQQFAHLVEDKKHPGLYRIVADHPEVDRITVTAL